MYFLHKGFSSHTESHMRGVLVTYNQSYVPALSWDSHFPIESVKYDTPVSTQGLTPAIVTKLAV